MSKTHEKGFILLELIVALALFIVVMTISMGAILGIFENNRKARAMKNVANSVNLAIESLSKELRYGKNFHCNINEGNIQDPNPCPAGDTSISFLSSTGQQLIYQKQGDAIMRSDNIWNNLVELTSGNVVIDDLKFYVLGTEPNDGQQPRVIIRVKAHAGNANDRSELNLQTLVTQRTLDQ